MFFRKLASSDVVVCDVLNQKSIVLLFKKDKPRSFIVQRNNNEKISVAR